MLLIKCPFQYHRGTVVCYSVIASSGPVFRLTAPEDVIGLLTSCCFVALHVVYYFQLKTGVMSIIGCGGRGQILALPSGYLCFVLCLCFHFVSLISELYEPVVILSIPLKSSHIYHIVAPSF